jgi:hypothetical protein
MLRCAQHDKIGYGRIIVLFCIIEQKAVIFAKEDHGFLFRAMLRLAFD